MQSRTSGGSPGLSKISGYTMETSKYPAIKKFKSSKTRENGIKVTGEAGGVNIFNHLEHAGFRYKK